MYFFLEAKGLGCHTKFKILLSEKKLEIFRRKKLLYTGWKSHDVFGIVSPMILTKDTETVFSRTLWSNISGTNPRSDFEFLKAFPRKRPLLGSVSLPPALG